MALIAPPRPKALSRGSREAPYFAPPNLATRSFSQREPLAPQLKLYFPPIPFDEHATDRIGRLAEESLALDIAELPEVAFVMAHVKNGYQDQRQRDLTVLFEDDRDFVPVHIQGKKSWKGYTRWMEDTYRWLRRSGSYQTLEEWKIANRLIVLASDMPPDENREQFRKCNLDIQERVFYERSRWRPVTLYQRRKRAS